MRDRVSTKILDNGATRYGVYDEDGKLLRYEYIKLEDEPSTEGDFFNKANMLPDSIPKLLGLKMANPQVKDALNVLAHVGNLHVWERVQTYADPVPEVPAGYTLGAVESGLAVTLPSVSVYSAGEGIRYGDVIVDNKGVVSVSGTDVLNAYNAKLYDIPKSGSSGVWISSDAELTELLRGKAIYVGKSVGSNTTTALETVYYVSGDSNVTKAASGNNIIVTFSKLQRVTGYPYTPAIPAGTTTDYLTSTNRNAYPDKSAEGGEPEKPAHYTLGEAETVDVLSSAADYSAMVYVCDLNSIIINNDGSINTTNFSTLMGGSNSLTMAGNWTKFSTTKAYYITSGSDNVVFTDTVFTVSEENTLTYSGGKYILQGCRKLIGHAKVEAIPANTTITYLGQLGGGARIEVGSYVGTGTYGESSPNSLTFDFVPKVVMLLFISAPVYGQNYAPTIYSLFQGSAYNPVMVTSMLTNSPQPNVGFMYNSNGGTDTYNYAWISSDKRTIYWYNTQGSTQQFNDLAYQTIPNTYHYVAIG